MIGANNFDASGNSVSSAGDINKDGYSDLIIGASGANPYSTGQANGPGRSSGGAVFVLYGRTNVVPTLAPTLVPSSNQTSDPTVVSNSNPTLVPTIAPSTKPTVVPSSKPNMLSDIELYQTLSNPSVGYQVINRIYI